MPYNPISGQFEYGGETYDAPTAGVGMAMEGMGAVGADIPLAFRMMENMPGITSAAMFNSRRFANTMFQGGFLDVQAGASAKKVARARKFGAFVGNDLAPVGKEGFLFSKYRNADKLAGKTPFFKPSRVNNFTLRPRALNRFSSVSTLSGMPNAGTYTPFQGTGILNPLAEKMGLRSRMVKSGAISATDESPLFSGGVLGRMSTMSRVYTMERQQARLVAKSLSNVGTRSGERAAAKSAKIGQRLGMLDQNLTRLGVTPEAVRATRATTLGAGFRGSSTYVPDAATSRLRQISDTSKGILTKRMTEYFGTALDPSKFVGTRAYGALEQNIARTVSGIAGGQGPISPKVTQNVTKFLAGETVDDLGKFGVKSLAKLSGQAFGQGSRMASAKLAGMAGTRALGLALPGLNIIGTAALVYDLTKMAGQAFISAGNFAKDAVKSMQGSLHKPLFGMGYKDNEVAATSRARGVMAIQNSRLNARSMLGAEAGMMAAHFG